MGILYSVFCILYSVFCIYNRIGNMRFYIVNAL